MIPEALRVKRSKRIVALAPPGTTWCAACQSFRDLVDFAKGATTCRACASAKTHASAIAKTYGITGDDYATLLEAQGGKCAICRARPLSKRLAVDHDHKSGAVRGLLCAGSQSSGCNFALGLFHDDPEILWRAYVYMMTPPASL